MALIRTADARRVALLCLLLAGCARAQVTTNRLTIIPSADDSATGEIRMREKVANGSNYTGFKAPASLAGNVIYTMPTADGTAGYVLSTNASGVLSWISAAGLPVVDTTTIVTGSSDATKLFRLEVDGLTTATTRVGTVPNANFTFVGLELSNNFTGTANNFAPSGTTGNQVLIRDLLMVDDSGLTTYWTWQCSANGAGNSNCRFKDNGGSDVLKLNATTGGATTRYGELMGDWRPTATATYDIGVTGTRWRAGYFSSNVNAAGIVTTSTSSMEQINPATPGTTTLGATGSRWGKLWAGSGDFSGAFAGASVLKVTNTDTAGYSVIEFQNSSAASQGFAGWGNASSSFPGMNFGTTGATSVGFFTSATARWEITSAGVLRPVSTLDLGGTSAANRIATLYGDNADFARSGITGNYVRVRDLQIADSAGGTSAYTIQSAASGSATSWLKIFDNGAGTIPLELRRSLASTTYDYALFDLHLVPVGTRDVGLTGTRWRAGYFSSNVNAAGVVTTSTSSMEQLNPATGGTTGFGTSGTRWGAMYGTTANFSGAITVASCTGCGGGLPAVDTTSIVSGSSDATKLLRFEVDGFTTATTRVLTPQNANYTIAGTDITNTFSASQTLCNACRLDTATDSNSQIGQSGQVFGKGYFKELYVGNASSGFFEPSITATIDVGGSSAQFRDGYFSRKVYGAFVDRGGRVFDIRNYGAVCDGSTNDTTAFNSAVTAAAAAGDADGGGTVYIPTSVNGCAVGNITVDKPVKIRGDGPFSSKLVRYGSTTGTLLNYSLATAGLPRIRYNVYIGDFSIVTSAGITKLLSLKAVSTGGLVTNMFLQGGAGATGIYCDGTDTINDVTGCGQMHFSYLTITNNEYGIHFDGEKNGELYLTDSIFYTDSAMTTQAQIYYSRLSATDTGGINISRVKITTGAGVGATVNAGMKFTSTALNTRAFIRINDCIIDSINGGSPLDFTNISEASIYSSTAYANVNGGSTSNPVLKITGGANWKVVGNTFANSGTATPATVSLLPASSSSSPTAVCSSVWGPCNVTFDNNTFDTTNQFAVDATHPAQHISVVGQTQTANGTLAAGTGAGSQLDYFLTATARSFRPTFVGPEIYTHTSQGNTAARFCNEYAACQYLRAEGSGPDLTFLDNGFTRNNFIWANSGSFALYGTITSSNASDGNVKLAPANVAGSASVKIFAPRLDQPGLIVRDASGTTTSTSFEVRTNAETSFFKIQGGTDASAAGTVSARDMVPITGSTYDIGKTGNRWANGNFVSVNVSSTSTFSGTATTRSILPGNSADEIGAALNRFGAIHVNAANVYGVATVRGLLPEVANVYDIGSFSNKFASIYAGYVGAYTQLYAKEIYVDSSGMKWVSNSGDLGQSTVRPVNTYLSNLNISGTVTAPSGNTGTSFSFSCGAGTAIKTLTVSGGLVTGATCGAP